MQPITKKYCGLVALVVALALCSNEVLFLPDSGPHYTVPTVDYRDATRLYQQAVPTSVPALLSWSTSASRPSDVDVADVINAQELVTPCLQDPTLLCALREQQQLNPL